MKWKKSLSLLLIMIICISLTGCKDQPKKASSDASENDNAAFSIWTWLGSVETWGGKSYNQVLAYKEMEKRTGKKVKYIHPTGDAAEAFNLMMTSGKMADAIWYHWSPELTSQYHNANRILDIYPIVKKHAPNLMKLIEENPELKKQVIDPQGKMYYMPWITLDKFLNLGEGLILREDWLKKVNKDVPKTNEELYQTLKAMKDQKVSGTKKFVGLTGYPQQLSKLFYGFGVADDWYLENNKVTYGPSTEKYKKALKWFNKMYEEGLIDKDFLTQEVDIYDKHLVEGQSAGFIDNTDTAGRIMKLASDGGNPFKFTPVPYLQYEGTSVSFNSTAKRVAQPYGLAISATAKNPEKIVKYLDYGYSEKGKTLFNWGIEGETFEKKGGKNVYTDKIMKSKDNVPGVEATKYVNPWWLTVTDVDATKALLDDDGVKTREAWADVDISNAIEPILYMTKKENDVVQAASTDIETYKSEMRDAFITGKKDIDKEWKSYVETLNSMGIKDIQKAKQSAHARYNNQ
ncbi:hypothetical protein [Fictibacillus fluitans]|uniref:ABC transporter substrate-binding protein n=1 Tax=Fictibacillus fluitans TaxID=3058422 RepID=A0ABT8I4D5_9BACL|nr:hypothetical protein [Fictibacillus sp. NE201]MDN4527402.1 hypothetical protein [Fictibacillus sp. NE201]